ncbi:MAG: tetratricopeptide repeat protein [Niastella sp.]|nr:tetratricopeptide repeat protein [Niastella sp.]
MKKIITILVGVVAFAGMTAGQTLPEAKKMIEHGRYHTAQSALHKIVQADPLNAVSWYQLTQAYLGSHELRNIKDSLLLAPEPVKQNAWYKVAYGHLLLAEGAMIEQAAVYFDQAIGTKRKKDVGILLAVANAYISDQQGDVTRALHVLDMAGKKDKRRADLNIMRGNAYRRLSNGNEAYKAYQAALNEDANQPEALYQLGKIFLTQQNSDAYVSYFKKAVAADPLFAPAWYELYYHSYYREPEQALAYFRNYLATSDASMENNYQLIDLLYINQRYDSAIVLAQDVLSGTSSGTEMPRLQKLMAYSYAALHDTANALSMMRSYFNHAQDSNLVVKDYDLMANLYSATAGKEDSALVYYMAVVDKTTDSSALFTYYKKLADLYKELKDPSKEALWLGRFYTNNPSASNVDLFNWGIVHYKAQEYEQADTVFGRYTEKYPDQTYGYYWRARANAHKDSAMEKGLAVSHYEKLVDVLTADTASATNKKWLVEAYGYLAAYQTNEKQDYEQALDYLNDILELDPANQDAKQYIAILEKKLDEE